MLVINDIKKDNDFIQKNSRFQRNNGYCTGTHFKLLENRSNTDNIGNHKCIYGVNNIEVINKVKQYINNLSNIGVIDLRKLEKALYFIERYSNFIDIHSIDLNVYCEGHNTFSFYLKENFDNDFIIQLLHLHDYKQYGINSKTKYFLINIQ